jgi:acyl-CoA synthetase (AMP-forming)/AMP-acid ligase II
MNQPRGTGVGNIVAHQARVHPRSLAVADAEEHIDFDTMNHRANRLANALSAAGVRRGDRVAVRIANSHRNFECLFACAKIAAIMVPIDFAASPESVGQIVDDSSPVVLLEGNDGFDSFVAGASAEQPAPTAGADDPLLIMYTSGTTGRPKGVVLTHNNVIYSSLNQLIGWQLTANDRVLIVAPCHHVGGLLALGFPCLHTGGSICFAPSRPEEILETIERERITALFLPPMLWGRLAGTAALEHAGLASVRLCASGGDPVPVRFLEHLIDGFQAEFTDAYGLTEASSCVTLLHGGDIVRRAGAAGKALVHNLVRVVDDNGNSIAPGIVGEIVVAGPTVMKQYWRRPEETAAAVRDGWLWTGDRGIIDDEGFLYVLGRSTDKLASGGAEIYPAEVERLLREHPGIAEVAVIGLADGDSGKTVAAVVVPQPGTRFTDAEIIEFCVGKIAEYKLPKVVFMSDSLPRNVNGKLIRSQLRELYRDAQVRA